MNSANKIDYAGLEKAIDTKSKQRRLKKQGKMKVSGASVKQILKMKLENDK
jgi:predicted lipoprotein